MTRGGVVVLLLWCVYLAGCADQVYWWDRLVFETDCRPEVVATNNGYCVSNKKGHADAQTLHP